MCIRDSPASAAAINASSTIMAPTETKGSILSVFKQKVKLFASRDNLRDVYKRQVQRRARKYNTGTIIITQQPSDFADPGVITVSYTHLWGDICSYY